MPTNDASFANDSGRRSSFDSCFMLCGGPIVWKTTIGRTGTILSTEAELLALSITAKEYTALMRLFEHIHLIFGIDTSIYCGNKQTIRLSKKKHLDYRQHSSTLIFINVGYDVYPK